MVHLQKLSVVVPLFNEAGGLSDFHKSLVEQLVALGTDFEIIYVDDGSSDKSSELIRSWHASDDRVKLIKLSRNFGKENALTAGIAQANGDGVLIIDGDGQHPVELVPEFVKAWQDGCRVVIGVRRGAGSGSWYKKISGRIFYSLFNRLTGERLIPGSTDFRLIDSTVQQDFLRLKESDRLTRGLIDWLGYERRLIYFEAKPRSHGSPAYSLGKLMRLAAHSFVSMTPAPLYLFGYLGVLITSGALILGSSVFVEQALLGDPWHWRFTGTALIGILLLFLVGIVLLSQGMLSLYISHIHSQTKQRPLYIIDYNASAGIKND